MNQLTLSIIIVTWNSRQDIAACLASIQTETASMPGEVIVIDNASTDGTPELVARAFPKVQLVRNQQNRGFAAACNQGLRLSRASYILLLNPDTVVLPRALETTVDFMTQHPRSGILGCQLRNPDNTVQKSVRNLPTLLAQLCVLLKVHHVFPRLAIFRHYFLPDFDYQKSQLIEQPSGAFFLLRKELLTAIGPLDERFWIWFEEVDYCARARAAGWEIWYAADAAVIHRGGTAFAQVNSLRKQMRLQNSLLRYSWKHWRFGATLTLYLCYPIGLLLAVPVMLFHLRRKHYDYN